MIINVAKGQWVQTNFPTSYEVNDILLYNNKIFAGVEYVGIYVSTDNGDTWNMYNNGISNLTVISLGANGSYLFAGKYGGYYFSTNNGASWTESANSDNKSFSHFLVNNGKIYAGTSEGLFLSTNNGTSWSDLTKNLLTDNTIHGIAIKGSNIYVTTQTKGVWVSSNNGTSWNAINNGITIKGMYMGAIAISGSNIIVGTDDGVFLSSDNGTNWQKVNGLEYVRNIVMTGNNVLAGGPYGIILSKDNGASWITIFDKWVESLYITGGYVLAGTNVEGIWKRNLSDILDVNEIGNRKEELGIKISPNPVNQSSVVSYKLSERSHVKVKVIDMIGREVGQLTINNEQLTIENEGEHTISLNAGKLRSGVYFLKIETDKGFDGRKFIIN